MITSSPAASKILQWLLIRLLMCQPISAAICLVGKALLQTFTLEEADSFIFANNNVRRNASIHEYPTWYVWFLVDLMSALVGCWPL